MCLNLSLSGIIFCGVDVGGFLDNCNEDLFIRWMGIGAWLPFFRNHTNNFTRLQEFWSFSKKCLDICRESLHRRYQSLRYLYSYIMKACRGGEPFIKPLFWIKFDEIHNHENLETTLCIGDLVISCETKPELINKKLHLPNYKIINWEYEFKELPKIYLRKGSIFYRNSKLDNTDALKRDRYLELMVNPDQEFAKTYFYFDDMETNHYEQGEFWSGELIYDHGEIKWNKLEGKLDLPCFHIETRIL